MKILVVDDSRVMRQIVIRTLRQAGYGAAEVLEATDGMDAFGKVFDFAPDVILSDWNMPEMTGIDLVARVRAGGYNGPFGFVTSEGSPAMREIAAASGADFLLAKPFTADDLSELLEPALLARQG